MITTILTFIVVLGILVFVHESGHYLAARHVGIRVLQFSIGFPPRLWGRKVGDTEYLISWIPLGGYVRLEGQNIEDENPRDPRNWAAKSVPQRFYVLVAGPAMNLILALVLMAVVYLVGVESPGYQQTSARIADVAAESAAATAGLQPGDTVTALGDVPTPTWDALFEELARQAVGRPEVVLTVRRDGRDVSIPIPSSAFGSDAPIGWRPHIPAEVGGFAPGAPAAAAGLRTGDLILGINGQPVTAWSDIPELVQQAAGEPMTLTILRDGAQQTVTVQAVRDETSQRWLIGISPPVNVQRYGPVNAVVLGAERIGQMTVGTFAFLGQLVTGNGSLDSLGGPVRIGAVLGDAARTSFTSLLFLMAFISLQLGILNLLPIPALDGGHILMLGAELLRGHPLSARLRERAQFIGFSLLMLLILFVTYNDILQLMT